MKPAKTKPKAKPLPPKPSLPPKERKLLVVLVCIIALGYLLSFSGIRYGRISDGEEMFATALSVYEFHELKIPNTNPSQNFQTGYEIYSKYGIGFPLVLLIPIFVADHLHSWFGWNGLDFLYPLANLALNLLTALCIALCARRMQLGWRAAYGAALGYAFGSFAWPYISFDFSEPLQAFCLIFAYWALLVAFGQERRQWLWLLLAGFASGYAVMAKALLVIAVPAFAAYLWMNTAGDSRKKLRTQAIFFIPVVCIGAALGIMNILRFGAFAETGYQAGGFFFTPLWEGLYGLLISPNKGLPMYAPLVLLLPWSLYLLYKARRSDVIFLGIFGGTLILVIAKWWSWEGGASWGPRLLYPLLPFLMLFSVYLTSRWKRAWIPVAALTAAGVAVNLLGILFFFPTWGNVLGANGDRVPLDAPGRPPREYQLIGLKKYFAPYVAANYVPALGPVPGHAWLLRWRYFGIPFPMADLLDQVPVTQMPYGPVTMHFEKLSQLAKRYPAFYREISSAELLLPAMLDSSGNTPSSFPIRAKTYFHNGDRFAQKKDLARAYYAYRKAYDLGYQTPELLPSLGGVCLSIGRAAEAQHYYEQHLADFPADHKVRSFYAQALESTGQYAKSLEQYRQLPQSDAVNQRIEALSRRLNPQSTPQGEIKK